MVGGSQSRWQVSWLHDNITLQVHPQHTDNNNTKYKEPQLQKGQIMFVEKADYVVTKML